MSTCFARPISTYQRRSPEQTPCYKVVRQALANFAADREAEDRPLPKYVLEEFGAYLRCGITAYGITRIRCSSPRCSHGIATAFSCKQRGFCPACCAKRKIQTATLLTQEVLPFAPYRQFVISFPFGMRYWLLSNRVLMRKVHRIVIQTIHAYYERKACSRGLTTPRCGSISFLQLFGSSLNVNPHWHILVLDGVFSQAQDKTHFHPEPNFDASATSTILETLGKKILRLLKRLGFLDAEGPVGASAGADEENAALASASLASLAGKIAFGPNAGRRVTCIGRSFGYKEEIPLAKCHHLATMNGFSLHAKTRTNTHARDRLAKLIEYIARGPLSNDRLELLGQDKIRLKLKSPRTDGTTHIVLTYPEFIEKLAALVPRPWHHHVIWSGVFAPNAKMRRQVVLGKITGPKIKPHTTDKPKPSKSSWSALLAKVFQIDVTNCPKCGGDMRIVACITDPIAIRRYLKHQQAQAPPDSAAVG